MITLDQSNRLEVLADLLAGKFAEGSDDPLRAETVVVPNPGMGRWLSQRLAERLGIVANLNFPLPASFFWDVLRIWLPQQEISPFDKETLSWRIQAALPRLVDRSEFTDLQRYLDGDEPSFRLFQLSRRIADVFDQYLVFRPETVLEWEQGNDTQWQAVLWRAITKKETQHRARLMQSLANAMGAPPQASALLPRRVFFFGLNALPPVYLEILKLLGQYTDVHISHLNVCEAYWGDLASEKTQLRRAQSLAGQDDPFAPFLDLGNPLLASMGHVGQVFLDQLLELEADTRDYFQAPAGDGLLPQLQRDILILRDGREDPAPLPGASWPSIQLHGTHTLLREVQVLRDNLLRCFQEIDDLAPRDILVMAPDIAAYGPFVEAVFGTADDERWIPFSMGDRSVGGENRLAEAITWLLGLPESRFEASHILSLLEVPAVQHRFDLEPLALERIRTWVRECGIRWAMDEAHRQALGLPGDEGLHSWTFGLRRLFFGYVTPVEQESLLYDETIVPYLDIDSQDLPWLGAMHGLLQRLDQWRQALARPRSLLQWRGDLLDLFDDFFRADDEDRVLLQAVGIRMDELLRQAEEGGFTGDLPLAVLRELLQQALGDHQGAGGFLQGGVTFSNLLPMRALPFRVICVLGMNGNDFPRHQHPVSFDQMASKRQRGDRLQRLDDRYLFLETVLSARDCLLLSYQSRDARSDKEKLPSEMVTELLEYLDACYLADGESLSSRLFVQHPLQPFSARYFDDLDPRLFTFDAQWAIKPDQAGAAAFYTGDLPGQNVPRQVDVATLIRFFQNPSQAFLESRLSMRLPGGEEVVEDREPFGLGYLESWQIKTRLLQAAIDHETQSQVYRQLGGEGVLPHGLPGEVLRNQADQQAHAVAQKVTPLLVNHPLLEPLAVELMMGDWRITGHIDPFTGKNVIDYRVGKLRVQDRLSLWIRHLLLCLQLEGAAAASIFVAEDETLLLEPVAKDEAEQEVRCLLNYFQEGLQHPLPFFPKTGWVWVNEGNWRREWEGDSFRDIPGERDATAIALLHRDKNPVDDASSAIAENIFHGIKNYQRKAL